jgi:hypothetical protein
MRHVTPGKSGTPADGARRSRLCASGLRPADSCSKPGAAGPGLLADIFLVPLVPGASPLAAASPRVASLSLLGAGPGYRVADIEPAGSLPVGSGWLDRLPISFRWTNRPYRPDIQPESIRRRARGPRSRAPACHEGRYTRSGWQLGTRP